MDFFSLLADHLISIILSLLPLTDAAKTSVLSRRWRHLWAQTTDFDINHRLFPDNLNKQIQCIDTILSSPQLNIHKLKISLPSQAPTDVKALTARWAKKVAHRRVTDVSLVKVGHARQALQRLMTSKSLTILKLQACILHTDDSSPLVACTSLKHIELKYVTGVSDTTIGEILSACENLKSLKMEYCGYLHQVAVKHQRLEYFVLRGCALKSDVDIETPNLRELELDVTYSMGRISVLAPMLSKSRICTPGSGLATNSDLPWSLRELLAGIRSTEELHLGGELARVSEPPCIL